MVIHKKSLNILIIKKGKYATMGWEIAQIIQKRKKRKKSLLWQLLVQKQKSKNIER